MHLIRRLFAGAVALYLLQWVIIVPLIGILFGAELWSISVTGHALWLQNPVPRGIPESQAWRLTIYICLVTLLFAGVLWWGFRGFIQDKPLPMFVMTIIAIANGIWNIRSAVTEAGVISFVFAVAMGITTIMAVVNRARASRR